MITKEFLTAGKAIFIVSNGKGESYKYRIKRFSNGRSTFVFKVHWLLGTGGMTYVGTLNTDLGTVSLPAYSSISYDSVPIKVVQWALATVWGGYLLPSGYSAENTGQCGRCGRRLTTPESRNRGLGPTCSSRVS